MSARALLVLSIVTLAHNVRIVDSRSLQSLPRSPLHRKHRSFRPVPYSKQYAFKPSAALLNINRGGADSEYGDYGDGDYMSGYGNGYDDGYEDEVS